MLLRRLEFLHLSSKLANLTCRHVNVIAYKEAFFDDASSTLCIVMEFCGGGDIYNKILSYKKKNQIMPEKEVWHYFIQIVRGLECLHDMKIVHRDIKSANLFITSEGVLKLGDLNVSKIAKKGMLQTQTGTPYYASPEVWKDQPYDSKSDIWSVGCVLYELATLFPPFRANDMSGLYKKIVSGRYSPLPASYSNDLHLIVKQLLQVTPSMRPSCK